jgi:hypothetical protein
MKNDNQMILLIVILKAKNFRKREIYDIKHEIIKKLKLNTNIHFSLEEMNSKILIIAIDIVMFKLIRLNKGYQKMVHKVTNVK